LKKKRAKDEKARVAQLNAQPQRKTRGDGSRYLKYPDGRIVEVPQHVTVMAEGMDLTAHLGEVEAST
jgi:hypothetical protein